MDGSLNFYFSSEELEVDTIYQNVSRHLLASHKGIAVLSPGSQDAWTGFRSMREAAKFKFEKGLGDDWRIRDRRETTFMFPGEELADAMLNVGTMISDHLRILVSKTFNTSKMPASVRRELMMFCFATLRESLISVDKSVGRWRPMRGKFVQNGIETSHCWLEDVPGNVIDVLPWNYQVAPAGYACHNSEFVKNYHGVSVMSDGYGTEFGAYLRGEREHAASGISAAEFRRRYITLGDHIVSYLARSRLPALN